MQNLRHYWRTLGMLCMLAIVGSCLLNACGNQQANATKGKGFVVVGLTVGSSFDFGTATASYAKDGLEYQHFIHRNQDVFMQVSPSGNTLNLTFATSKTTTGALGALVFKVIGNDTNVTLSKLQTGKATIAIDSSRQEEAKAPPAVANPKKFSDSKVTTGDIAYTLEMINYPLGDIDKNGQVELADSIALRAIINGAQANDFQRYHADIVADGSLDYRDIAQLIRKITGVAPVELHVVPQKFAKRKDEKQLILLANAGSGALPASDVGALFGEAPPEVTPAQAAGRAFAFVGDGNSRYITFLSDNAGDRVAFNDLGIASKDAPSTVKRDLADKAAQSSHFQALKRYVEGKGFQLSSSKAYQVVDQDKVLYSDYIESYSQGQRQADIAFSLSDAVTVGTETVVLGDMVYGTIFAADGEVEEELEVDAQGNVSLEPTAYGCAGAQHVAAEGDLSLSPQQSNSATCQACKDDCKKKAKNCKKQVSAVCKFWPGPGRRACKSVYTRNCKYGNTYCNKIGCELGFPAPCDPPKPTPTPPPPPPKRSANDPHLYTFDGLSYDFQAVGEFILLSAEDKSLVVQARQAPWRTSSTVSANSAIAVQTANDRIAFYARAAQQGGTGHEVFINGSLRTVDRVLELPNGSKLYPQGTRYLIETKKGAVISVDIKGGGRWLNVGAALPDSYKGNITGLLGNFDGDKTNDLQTRDKRVLAAPVSFDTLYKAKDNYADSWRITQAESLFDYQNGDSTATFTDRSFPSRYVSVATLPAADVAKARAICLAQNISNPVALENCILDVAVTKEEVFATAFDNIPDTESLEVSHAIFLDGWQQEGEPTNGDWVVADDGRSVLQRKNGDPTFFVSTAAYGNTTITGELKVEGAGDDDLIGFVFGYQSPLSSNKDAVDDYKFLIFDWKRTTQADPLGTAQEGFSLGRFSGTTPLNPFWDRTDSQNYSSIATNYGAGKGWQSDTAYRFKLLYSATRVQISIDDTVIFDAKGDFPLGRFGFYNYSQPNVRYSNFQASNGVNFEQANWALLGSARSSSGRFELTPQERGNGAAWHKYDTLDLSQDFQRRFLVHLGANDAGADGMVFFMSKTIPNKLGSGGGGMGFARLCGACLGVEMDTYSNSHDPKEDHIALVNYGNVNHKADANLNMPVKAMPNLEDGNEHTLDIAWQAATKLLTVSFDGQEVIQSRRDLAVDVFDATRVHYGFTAATGLAQNAHYFIPVPLP